MKRWPTVRLTRGLFVQAGLTVVAAVLLRWGAPLATTTLQVLTLFGILATAIIVHEGAHVVAAHRQGLRVEAVVIRGILDAGTLREAADSPRADIPIILAGPAASAALALGGGAIAVTTPDLLTLGGSMLAVNLFIALASLLAGPRSDGWRAWRAWRSWRGRPATPQIDAVRPVRAPGP